MDRIEPVGAPALPPLKTEAVAAKRQHAPLDEGARQLPPNDNRKPDERELRETVDQINRTLEIYHTELRFSVHEASGEMMVRVINTETNEVIREIPPERVLNIVAQVKKMLGIILDKFI